MAGGKRRTGWFAQQDCPAQPLAEGAFGKGSWGVGSEKGREIHGDGSRREKCEKWTVCNAFYSRKAAQTGARAPRLELQRGGGFEIGAHFLIELDCWATSTGSIFGTDTGLYQRLKLRRPGTMDLFRQITHPYLRSILSHRIQLYSFVSLLAVSGVVLNALRNFSNFYSVAIYLSKSGRSVLVCSSSNSTLRLWTDARQVLTNFAVLLALFCGHVVQCIFFGSLRPNEVEVRCKSFVVPVLPAC